MQVDPVGLGGGINLYKYVKNNPANMRDPSGLAGENPQNLQKYCERLAKRIENLKKTIEKKKKDLEEDKLGLPENCPESRRSAFHLLECRVYRLRHCLVLLGHPIVPAFLGLLWEFSNRKKAKYHEKCRSISSSKASSKLRFDEAGLL